MPAVEIWNAITNKAKRWGSNNPAPVYLTDTSGTYTPGGGGGGTSGGTATAASPTYTEGATAQPLSQDLKGNLRTRLLNSAGTDALPTALATGGGLKVTVQDTAGTPLDYTVPALVGGDIAHDSPVSTSKPIMVAGRATTANPTAVADADVSRIMVDKLGKVIAVSAVRDLKGVGTQTYTNTTEASFISAIASTFNDLYGLVLSNSSATATTVTIRDSLAGTTRAVITVPAGETRGFMLDAGSALTQATVNTAWTAQCSAGVTTLTVTGFYVKNI